MLLLTDLDAVVSEKKRFTENILTDFSPVKSTSNGSTYKEFLQSSK